MSQRARSVAVGVLSILVLLTALTGGVTAQTDTASPTPTPTATPASDAASDSPLGPFDAFDSFAVVSAFIVLAFAVIGAWSKSLAIGAWSGYLSFLFLSFETQYQFYLNIAYVTLILVFLGFAFKLIRLEFEGEA